MTFGSVGSQSLCKNSGNVQSLPVLGAGRASPRRRCRTRGEQGAPGARWGKFQQDRGQAHAVTASPSCPKGAGFRVVPFLFLLCTHTRTISLRHLVVNWATWRNLREQLPEGGILPLSLYCLMRVQHTCRKRTRVPSLQLSGFPKVTPHAVSSHSKKLKLVTTWELPDCSGTRTGRPNTVCA